MARNKKNGRLPKLDSHGLCDCTETLAERMNKNRIACKGVMVILDKQGIKRVGLHTTTIPKVLGAKSSTGLVIFNFCPWCGIKLIEEETSDVTAKHSQN